MKLYKDTMSSSLKACNIPVMGGQNLARDHSVWRHSVQEGVSTLENQQLLTLDQKCKERKLNSNEAVV